MHTLLASSGTMMPAAPSMAQLQHTRGRDVVGTERLRGG